MDDRVLEPPQRASRGKETPHYPAVLKSIEPETKSLGFDMASDPAVGAFLCSLVASKPGGTILELGTGTGISTAWLAAGLQAEAKLVSVDNDPAVQAIAQTYLGGNPQITFCLSDGADFIEALEPFQFDLIFADAWPGKYSHLDKTLLLLNPGGLYVVDDLLPQDNWPEGHQKNVDAFVCYMATRKDLIGIRCFVGDKM